MPRRASVTTNELGGTRPREPEIRDTQMLYLIGGVARAGKSTAAESFMRTAGVSCLGVDYIKMAFSKAMPELGIHPEADDRDTARELWPFVEAMATTMIENDQDYTFEGAYILPEHAVMLSRAAQNLVRSCFIGFAGIETDRKVSQIKKYRGIGDDWLQEASDAELTAFVHRAKEASRVLRTRCAALGLAYFDNANDFQSTIDDVVAYLGADQQSAARERQAY